MILYAAPRISARHRPRGLDIIYEDPDILVIDKAPGLLTMSFHKDQIHTAERILTDYVRKGNSRSKKRVFVVHRLDRDTSGLLVFAKTFPAQQQLKNDWENTEKLYLAAVWGRLEPQSGVIESHLIEDDDQFVSSTRPGQGGKLAKTQFRVIRQTRRLSIVKIKLLTGRKNQIRVHFAEKGHPVIGDLKYGPKDKIYPRLALHAKYFAFNHPSSGQRMIFETSIPEFFKKIAKGLTEADWEKT